MSGKKKRSRWIGALAALLGVVCALILCALFYGTMVYQLAGESGGDAAPAGGTLALSAGTLEDESRQNIRMGGKTCDVLTRTYRLEGGAQVQAVTASPAAYIERMKEEGWQAQLITGFAIGPAGRDLRRQRGKRDALRAERPDRIHDSCSGGRERAVRARRGRGF